MLDVKRLPDVDLKSAPPFIASAMGDEDDGERGYLVIGLGEQILGAGVRDGVKIVKCWGVNDLQADHWVHLIHPSSDSVQIARVSPGLTEIIRKTMARFSADGQRRIVAANQECRGLDAAIATVVKTAMEVSREQGGSGRTGTVS